MGDVVRPVPRFRRGIPVWAVLAMVACSARAVAAQAPAPAPWPWAEPALAVGVEAATLPSWPPAELVTFPAGTALPIRFLHRLAGGRDRAGTPVLVQTLAALVSDGCVVVDPFTQLAGHVTRSLAGGRFGRPGELALEFDSLQLGSRRWVAVTAVLDSLEYASSGSLSGGDLEGGHHPRRGRLLRTGAMVGAGALAEEAAAIPVALLEGWRLARRGPRAAILAGEVARVRLTQPLQLPPAGMCVSPDAQPDLVSAPELPPIRFAPRTQDDRAGRHPGDPINVLLLGPRAAIDSAFARAGWVPAQRPSLRSLARGITAALIERSAVGAPVSTQYFQGRPQDLAFELSGPNARYRHHLRIWRLDVGSDAWVAAADQDVGLLVNPFRRTATHRIARDVDVERDLLVRVLEATGCADLMQYVTPPGALVSGRNASGQTFQTDGRTAVVRVKRCEETDVVAVQRP